MNKLVVAILGQNCQNTINMCLESVKDADVVIYLDGGSTDNTLDIVRNFKTKDNSIKHILTNPFNKSNPDMISIQRNFYLDFLKKTYKDDWCLVLDADEILDTNGIKKLKNFTNDNPISEVYSLKMRHLMYTLGYEDNSQPDHFVPHRFFKILDKLFYPKGEHCVLDGMENGGRIVDPIIWHLAYLGGVWDVKKRYDQQILRDSGHPKEFLNEWNKTHILGRYPVSHVDVEQLPNIILENFGINPEEFYFEQRGQLEVKHGVMVKQWNEFFKPKTVADFGCGRGLYLYFWEMVCRYSHGYELSQYAINNKICQSPISQADMNKDITNGRYDLVTAIDILEHLTYENIDKSIDNLIQNSKKYILTSIPYKGTPNCERDKTHIIKEDRDWWVKKFEDAGLIELNVPDHWLFKEQLLLFKKAETVNERPN